MLFQKSKIPVPCCFTKLCKGSGWSTAISEPWKTSLGIHLLYCFIEYHCVLFQSIIMAMISPTNMIEKKWTITLLLGKNSLRSIYWFSYLVHTNLKTKACLQCKQGGNLAKRYKTSYTNNESMTINMMYLLCFWNMENVLSGEQKIIIREGSENCMGK